MKRILPFYFLLLIIGSATAQITKVETYQIGTQIDYYIGECGNSMPEAQGKLSFCDRAGNLAVVEVSLGLNSRSVSALIPNYFNDSEVYVTRNGVSIYHTDGRWENIPNVAFQNPEVPSFNNTGSVTGGVVLPNGKLLLHVNDAGFYIHTYDLLTKELTLSASTGTTGIGFPAIRNITYDEQTGKIYLFMVSGSSRYLYEYVNDSYILLNDSDELFFVFPSTNVVNTAVKDGVLYAGSTFGLFAIDLENAATITKYDASDTGILPLNRVNDFEIASDGTFWLAQQATDNNSGGVTKFDLENETFELYTRENPNGTAADLLPRDIALNPDGRVHTTCSNYNGVADLSFENNIPTWTIISEIDFEVAGTPLNNFQADVTVLNNSIYYNGTTTSSGISNDYEVVIRTEGSFTGRNDNAPSNISYSMANRFTEVLPTNDGGSWWINSFDDLIVQISPDNVFTPDFRLQPSGIQGAVDQDQNYVGVISVPGQGSDVRKVYNPTSLKFESDNDSGNRVVTQYNDQIWVFNRDTRTIDIFINNTVVQTYQLDPGISLSSYFDITVDSNGVFWAVKPNSGVPRLISFDSTTETLSEIDLSSSFNSALKIVPTPDGGLWIVSSNNLIFYKDGIEYAFSNELLDFSGIQDVVVDTSGKLHILGSGGIGGNLFTIENPTATDPIINATTLVGTNGLLPTESLSATDDLIIDALGNYWFHGGKSFYKLIDSDTTPFYKTQGISKGIISGRLYGDVNDNGVYDEGEALPGVSVALSVNGELQNTISDNEGIYRVFAQEENTSHRVTITAVDDDFFLLNRNQEVAVTSLDQNYTANDFIFEVKDYNALILKQGQRLGLWGFDRAGFENTFTVVVSNMSTTKTFNELTSTFLFDNQDGNELPEILDVVFTKLDPDGLTLLHKYITINPKDNSWNIQGITPEAYTREDVPLTYSTLEEPGETRVIWQIPAIAPRDTWVIEIKTDLFDPTQTGTTVVHTTESMGSPDFEDAPEGPPPGGDVYIMYPEEERDYGGIPLPSEDLNSPYIDPSDPPQDGTFIDPSEVYAPVSYESPIFSSYDPNDKMVDGGNALEINETDIARKWLTYTIRFENQGNFSAKDVYILDQLDSNIIPDSFTLLESSDPVVVDFLPSGEMINSQLRFSFNNIFLPFDDENNDGWIKFRVRVKEDIPENTLVENTAEIYFDQNPAIITNTIQNLFKTPEAQADTEAPNVVCQNITVSLDENGLVTFTAQDIDGGSTDNVGITSLIADVTSLSCDNLGENEVILTGMDAAGNMNACTAIVTVIDEISPTATCNAIEITLNEQGEATITVDQLNNSSTDNCGIVSLTLDTTTFTCADLGENTVTLTLVDASGNEANCEATVTIIDAQTPEADETTLPEDQTVLADENNEYILDDFTIDITVIENCEFSISQVPPAGTVLNLGVTTIQFTIEDNAGNTTLPSFELTVDSSLSIGDQGRSEWVLYPNPVQDILYVESISLPTSIQLYDLSGKLVKESRDVSQLEMTLLPKGIYLLQVISGESAQTFKILKE